MFQFDQGEFGGEFSQPDFAFSQSVPTTHETSSTTAGRAESSRDLLPGVLPVTIAMCRNALGEDGFEDGKPTFLRKQWSCVYVVGFIVELDTSEEGLWLGELRDYTGKIPFRYEPRSGMSQSHIDEQSRMIPVGTKQSTVQQENEERNTSHSCSQWLQTPCKAFGQPQVVDGELVFFASHLKVAEYEEMVATHILETASFVMTYHVEGPERPGVDSAAPSPSVERLHSPWPIDREACDPYQGEPIVIADSDTNDVVGPDRLRRVMYKYLDDARAKEHRVDDSESVISLRQFCSQKWKPDEIAEALDDLIESGVLEYPDETKMRVQIA